MMLRLLVELIITQCYAHVSMLSYHLFSTLNSYNYACERWIPIIKCN